MYQRGLNAKMFKVIAKTALKTLLAAVIILCLAFGVASLGFPAKMAGFFEKCGNYEFATGYASLNYTYSHKTADLARCFNNSAMAKNNGNVIHFGNMLLADEGFDTYCKENAGYRQFACGKIACARYVMGDGKTALKLAEETVLGEGGFPKNNALVSLMLAAEKDKEMLSAIKTAMEKVSPAESEAEYYATVTDVLNGLLS